MFVAVLDHMEGKGFVLTEAEALAYATMQVLMQRRGDLVRFAPSRMPDEVAELVEAVKDVFGDDVQVEWRPAQAPERLDQTEQHGGLVYCRACRQFELGEGNQSNALGLCHGQPWDEHRGQWPKLAHRCGDYTSGRWGRNQAS